MAYEHLGRPLQYIDGYTEYQLEGVNSVLARLVYSEACNESYQGKQGVLYTVSNRVAIQRPEFGTSVLEVCLNRTNGFDGMKTSLAHTPDTSSQAWADSCYIAILWISSPDPIGKCLWFNTNSLFNSRLNSSGKYTFDGGKTYKTIVEKVIIGNHTFFRVEGYDF